MVSPCLLQSLEELLASNSSLVRGCATQTLRTNKKVGREQLLNSGTNFAAQPLPFEIVDVPVQVFAFLLKNDTVGVAIELLV